MCHEFHVQDAIAHSINYIKDGISCLWHHSNSKTSKIYDAELRNAEHAI